MNIVQSQPVEKYGIRFDSKWELHVYEFLLAYFPPEDIRVHVDVLLYRQEPHIPRLSMNIDFQIISQDLWIEAKGDIHSIINDAFKVKYHVLARVYPRCFNRLLVVDNKGGRRLPASKKTTISLVGLIRLFREMKINPIK